MFDVLNSQDLTGCGKGTRCDLKPPMSKSTCLQSQRCVARALRKRISQFSVTYIMPLGNYIEINL